MLTDTQIAVLCDIGQSIAFSDDKRDQLFRLIADGYVREDGDTFELTAKGEGGISGSWCGIERGVISLSSHGNRYGV